MSTLSITLPSHTFITNGKHVTFKAPCNSKGVTGLIINNDDQEYKLMDSRKQALPKSISVFEADAMVHVILDVENHIAYIQNASGTQGTGGVVGDITPADIGAATDDHTHNGVYSAAKHKQQHSKTGSDPITPEDIGAATATHNHDEYYSPIGHYHDERYAPIKHDHDVDELKGVAKVIHSHKIDDIEDAFTQNKADLLYATIAHTHDAAQIDGVLSQSSADLLYAPIECMRNIETFGEALAQHTHNLVDIGAAAVDHGHTLSQLGAAAASHTHTALEVGALSREEANSLYAGIVHTHNASEVLGVLAQDDADLLYAPIACVQSVNALNQALEEHTHSTSDITGISDVGVSGSYSDLIGVPEQFSPSAHALTHAAYGEDPITPESIGALDKATADGLYVSKSYVDEAIATAIANIDVYDGTVNYENM